MQFNRLRLTNWKCYEEEDLSFDTGITVVHGVNGAGKSTLLEACYFALYGTDALPSGKSREDSITSGKTELEVELWFTHARTKYRIYRRISDPDSSEYVYAEVELETPDDIYEKEGDVQEIIQGIVRMDATAFLNCSYVRQGDITRLIHSSPSDRQNIIDRLLQLGKLKTYRERMDFSLRGARKARESKRTELQKVEQDIEELEDLDLKAQLAQVNEELDEVNDLVEEIDNDLEDAKAKRDDVQDQLEEFEDKRDELDEVSSELEETRTKLEAAEEKVSVREDDLDDAESELENARSAVQNAMADADVSVGGTFDEPVEPAEIDRTALQEAIDELEEEITEYVDTVARLESTIEAMNLDKDTFQRRATDLETQAEELEAEAEKLTRRAADQRDSDLAEKKTEVSDLEEDIQTARTRFTEDDVPDEVEYGDADVYAERIDSQLTEAQQEQTGIKKDIENLTEQIAHAESLIDEGRCPECGQEVDEAPAVTQLEDRREEKNALEDELAAVEETIDSLKTDKALAEELQQAEADVDKYEHKKESATQRIEEIEGNVERLEQDAEAKREEANAKRREAERWQGRADRLESERGILNTELEDVQEEQTEAVTAQDDLIRLDELIDDYVDAYEEQETAEELLSGARETMETHEGRVDALSEREKNLEEAIDDERVEMLEQTISEAKDEIDRLTRKREMKTDERDELNTKKGKITSKLDNLEDEREAAAELRRKEETLADAVSQLEEVDQMYGGLRETLREANVSYLEQLLNDIFGLIYENDAYAYIELNRNYEITVHEKGGETLDPDELSGGEQALFNLALRCAIYQLLAEGIDGEAPLPPLILDEPTVHLDETHIGRINDLAERMRQLGVEQTIVVSHSKEIVDSADERIEVTQDASTNRSQATVESADLLSGI